MIPSLQGESRELLQPVVVEAEAFLAQSSRSPAQVSRAWIGTDIMRGYLRAGPRSLDGAVRSCLWIASITVSKLYRQRGLFAGFIWHMHSINPYQATLLEHATNLLVEQWCVGHGWKPVPRSFPPSFYLLTPGQGNPDTRTAGGTPYGIPATEQENNRRKD